MKIIYLLMALATAWLAIGYECNAQADSSGIKKNIGNEYYAQPDINEVSDESNSQIDTLSRIKFFETGLKKVTNTFIFSGNSEYNIFSPYGNFHLYQQYTGTALQTARTSFRDDEKFFFRYTLPISNGISLLGIQNWSLSNDTKSIGINKLERLNGMLGIRYDFLGKSFFSLSGGLEKNNQIGVESAAWLLETESMINSIKIEQFTINADATGDYLHLDDGRINAGAALNARISGNYDVDNSMGFLVGYKLFNRDFLSTLYQTNEFYPIERRFEKRLNLGAIFDFKVSDKLSSRVNLSMSDVKIDRSYKEQIEKVAISKVYRNLTEFQLIFLGEIFYTLDYLNITAGANFFSRNEENNIFKNFEISNIERANLQNLENQRDNSASKTRLYSSGRWQPTRNDLFSYDYSVSLLQYDTPSEINNDDRDEFSTVFGIGYLRNISSMFSAGLNIEIQMTHLVFLKAASSAMNNWNRIIRLAPEFKVITKSIVYEPMFELLANYTVYDFESLSPGVQSFSYRQLGYRDSLCIYFGKGYSLQSRSIIKYFERGMLYWRSFSEAPQTSSYEQFSKVLFISHKENFAFGAGGRMYFLSQSNINRTLFVLSPKNDFSQIFVGPEALITLSFDSGTTFSLNGWYDFQYFKKQKTGEVPNMVLSIKWVL